MNVLELLTNELKDKNWNIEQKSRYIYIRSCELFHYDERYHFSEDFDVGISKSEIISRKIDLENVFDNRVICTTHANIISKLLEEILNIECKSCGTAHSWNEFYDSKRMISADATSSPDIARVKMKLATNGYRALTKDYNFTKELKEIDKIIGYIKDEYENVFLINKINNLFDEFKNYSKDDKASINSDDFLIYQIFTVKEIFDSYSSLKTFADSEFCISYLLNKLIEKYIGVVVPIMLFNKDNNETLDFVNVYTFKLCNEIIYFILRRVDDRFCFYETTESDAKHYIKTLQGYKNVR